MAKRRRRAGKTARNLLSLLLFLALLLAVDCFAGDPAGVLQANAPGPAAASAAPAAFEQPAASPESTQPGKPAASPSPAGAQTGALSVYVLDVGQGDSIFLKSPSGKTMLVDAAESDEYKTIDAFLKKQQVKKLDVVIATHPHADHIGSMRSVVSHYPVGVYYMTDAVNNTASYENLIDTLKSRKITVKQAIGGADSYIAWDDAAEVRILSPLPGKTYDDLNNTSIVCRVRFGDTSILLTGDAESIAERDMLETLPAELLRATVLKAGHHGSNSSSSPDFLDAVSPKAAVISCGLDNAYGHPHEETLESLAQRDIRVYRTDQDGTVHITLDGKGYTVETEK